MEVNCKSTTIAWSRAYLCNQVDYGVGEHEDDSEYLSGNSIAKSQKMFPYIMKHNVVLFLNLCKL